MRDSLFFRLLDTLTLTTVSKIVVWVLGVMLLYALYEYCGVDYITLFKRYSLRFIRFLGSRVNAMEQTYQRDLLIGRIKEVEKNGRRNRKVKHYRFLNDLIIDLGLKERGCTPYEFLFALLLFTFIGSITFASFVFRNTALIIFIYPLLFIGVVCALYTKANVAHDRRIDAILESENAICNNIKNGVVVAVRNSIDLIPLEVRNIYRDFLDDVESKNIHIVTALQSLNNNLGSITDDFIKKCCVLETEEEKGMANMFKDIVEVNNIKTEIRTDMKRKFEKVVLMFLFLMGLVSLFIVGMIVIYPVIRRFYLHNPVGQIILIIDALIMVGEFVYITKQKAISF